MKNLLEQQVGGTHYRDHFKIQPIELIVQCKWDFIQGNIAKYILRAPYKNGEEDLAKAQQYCDLFDQNNDVTTYLSHEVPVSTIKTFVRVNDLPPFFEDIFGNIHRKQMPTVKAQIAACKELILDR